jgi:hypothetical protein
VTVPRGTTPRGDSCPAGLFAEMGLWRWRRFSRWKPTEIPNVKTSQSQRNEETRSSNWLCRPLGAGNGCPAHEIYRCEDRSHYEASPSSGDAPTTAGVTITAMMKATEWQPHSVRGFLAGVVKKKLRLRIESEKIDGHRVYPVVESSSAHSKTARSRRRVA